MHLGLTSPRKSPDELIDGKIVVVIGADAPLGVALLVASGEDDAIVEIQLSKHKFELFIIIIITILNILNLSTCCVDCYIIIWKEEKNDCLIFVSDGLYV